MATTDMSGVRHVGRAAGGDKIVAHVHLPYAEQRLRDKSREGRCHFVEMQL